MSSKERLNGLTFGGMALDSTLGANCADANAAKAIMSHPALAMARKRLDCDRNMFPPVLLCLLEDFLPIPVRCQGGYCSAGMQIRRRRPNLRPSLQCVISVGLDDHP